MEHGPIETIHLLSQIGNMPYLMRAAACKRPMFQSHTALIVANNDRCLTSGLMSDIWREALLVRSMEQ